MTKNNISVDVITKGAEFTFTGEHGAAALAAVRAHQDIHAMGQGSGPEGLSDLVIPYSAVNQVDWSLSQTDETVEDANCKVQTPAPEVASLVLHNKNELSALGKTTITLSDTSINGTYSGVTFTDGVATIASGTIAAGASLTISGLPDGLQVSARVSSGTPKTGTTPCTLELQNPSA